MLFPPPELLAMDLSRLAVLKQKLVEATDFHAPWDYFMTHFGEQRAFMRLGQRTRVPVLEETVARISSQIFGAKGRVSGLLLTRLAEQRFVHGGFNVQGRFGNVFYFEDDGVGLYTVSAGAGEQNHLVRFTALSDPSREAMRARSGSVVAPVDEDDDPSGEE